MYIRLLSLVVLVCLSILPTFTNALWWSFYWSRAVTSLQSDQQIVRFTNGGKWYLASESNQKITIYEFVGSDRQPIAWWTFDGEFMDMEVYQRYPILAFQDITTNKWRFMRYDWSSWIDMNLDTLGPISDVRVDAKGKVWSEVYYVVYKEQWWTYDQQLSAQIHDGTTWNFEWPRWLSNNTVGSMDMQVKSKDMHVLFADDANQQKAWLLTNTATVREYFQSSESLWSGISAWDAIDLTIDASPAWVYIAYIDPTQSNWIVVKSPSKKWRYDLATPANFNNRSFVSLDMVYDDASSTLYLVAEDDMWVLWVASSYIWKWVWSRSWLNDPNYLFVWKNPSIKYQDGIIYVSFSDTDRQWSTSVVQSVLKEDATPDAITFDAQFDVPLNDMRVSNTITVAWFDVASVVYANNGWEVSVNGNPFQLEDRIQAWDTLQVRQISSSSFSKQTDVQVFFGKSTPLLELLAPTKKVSYVAISETNQFLAAKVSGKPIFSVTTRPAVIPTIDIPADGSTVSTNLVSIAWLAYSGDMVMIYIDGVFYGSWLVGPTTDYMYVPRVDQAMTNWTYVAEAVAYEPWWIRIPWTGTSTFAVDLTYVPIVTVSPQITTWVITVVTWTVTVTGWLTNTTLTVTVDWQTTTFNSPVWDWSRTLPTPLSADWKYDVVASSATKSEIWYDITTDELIIDTTKYAIDITSPANWTSVTVPQVTVFWNYTWLQNIRLQSQAAWYSGQIFSWVVPLVLWANTITAIGYSPSSWQYTDSIVVTYTLPAQPIAWICGSVNNSTVSTMPQQGLCASWLSTAVSEWESVYIRQCFWQNWWATSSCSANKTSWSNWWGWWGGGWWGGGWGWSWTWTPPDDCPDWDKSWSKFDRSCGTKTDEDPTEDEDVWSEDKKEDVRHGAGSPRCVGVPRVTNSNKQQELIDAYTYAYCIGSTTIDDINDAQLDWFIKRKDFAKMISEFAKERFDIVADPSRKCEYTDMWDQNQERQDYARLSCELWVMWLKKDWRPDTTFRPEEYMTRAMVTTTLSRIVFRWRYNWQEWKRYEAHMQALAQAKIIQNVYSPTPDTFEKKWNVILMMYRSDKLVHKRSDLEFITDTVKK